MLPTQDNIGEAVIKAIQPYIDNEDFQPAAIAKVSKACTSICQWVRAMHKYHFVAKAVEPKRVRTKENWWDRFPCSWRGGELSKPAPHPILCTHSKPCGRPRTTWR